VQNVVVRPRFQRACWLWGFGFAILVAFASAVIPALRLRRLDVATRSGAEMDTPRQIVTVTLLGFHKPAQPLLAVTGDRDRHVRAPSACWFRPCPCGGFMFSWNGAAAIPGGPLCGGDGGQRRLERHSADSIGPIMDAPGIRKDPDGSSLPTQNSSPPFRASRKPSGMTLLCCGVLDAKALKLRPELKIVAGRMFRPERGN